MENCKNENRETLIRIRDEIYQYQNGEIKNDDGETLSIYDYFDDVLDFEYTISSRREYLGVTIWVALGGPSICIDTREKKLKLFWWSDYDDLYLDSDLCEEIDQIFEDFYNC